MEDFNHCKQELVLLGYGVLTIPHEAMKSGYAMETYCMAQLRCLVANSDKYTVYCIPNFETFLKSSKPKTKAVAIWSNESMESLKSWFLITDREEITDWIYCTDGVIAKKKF